MEQGQTEWRALHKLVSLFRVGLEYIAVAIVNVFNVFHYKWG